MKEKELKEGFARRLKAIAAYKGLSQTELAQRADVSINSLASYYQAKNLPPAFSLCKIADVLGTTPDVLFGYKPTNLD